MAPLTFDRIRSDIAVDLFEALQTARRLQLQPALSAAVVAVGVPAIDIELRHFVPLHSLSHVAALGLRGERVFPVPTLLAHAPPLIGYYRMLLGLSRKEFSSRLRYGPWLAAEERGVLPKHLHSTLDQFCAALVLPLVELVDAMHTFDDRDLSDLTLLTLGPTLQGGRNNVIGTHAALQVFAAIRSLVAPRILFEDARMFRFKSQEAKTYEVVAASDPDIRIDLGQGADVQPVLAIEIKGGSDRSNAHNRAGEAEKSQIKASRMGYRERWTIIRMAGVNPQQIRNETPSSTAIFEAADVISQTGPDWDAFRQMISRLIDPPLSS